MAFSYLDWFYWIAAASLETIVFALAIRRKLFQRLPFFTAYLGLLLANDFGLWFVYKLAGFRSLISFDSYWTIEALLVIARALAVYNISQWLLHSYAGVWRLAKPFLGAIAAVLVLGATFATPDSEHRIETTILTADRGLELVVVGVLLVGLAFCRYYGVRIERYIGLIALGLGFYSAVQVANNTFLQRWVHSYFPMWADLRHASFNIATGCWLVALLRPLPAEQPTPILLASSEYDSLTPQVTARLRGLNTRLLEIWK